MYYAKFTQIKCKNNVNRLLFVASLFIVVVMWHLAVYYFVLFYINLSQVIIVANNCVSFKWLQKYGSE